MTFQINIYPDTQHAFHNDTGPRWNEAQALQAWNDTISWFETYVKDAAATATASPGGEHVTAGRSSVVTAMAADETAAERRDGVSWTRLCGSGP